MASKFLNLSTDTTLGGSSSADDVVPSQKAIKTYVDSQTGQAPAFANIVGQPTDNANLASALNAKQDVISNLATIESGAAAGATAVQPGDLATVATTGDYDDLLNKPTIPTVNNATLTIQKNGTTVNTFTANASSNVTANITVPTKISDLTNDSNFADKDLSNLTSTGKNLGNWSTNVSNCITEIPQDIKLELNNGTLTLKAGSKVYVPNGSGVFDVFNITADIQLAPSGSLTGQALMFVRTDNLTLNRIPVGTTYSGSTQPSSDGYWYDTTNNKIYWIDGGTLKDRGIALPIALVHATNGTVDSIDQVFNGFGYIGSTVFALPGVEGLIPNGRNDDGTLKNTPASSITVHIYTSTSAFNGVIGMSASGEITCYTNLSYDSDDNYNYQSGARYGRLHAGTVIFGSGGKITNFTPKTAFHAVDYNEYDNFKVDALTKDEQNVKLTGTQTITGAKTFSSTVTVGSSTFAYNGHIELVPASSATNGGYLDFHYAGSSSDYTSRLIEDGSGHLSYLGAAALSSDHSTSSNVVATKGWANATVNEMRTNCITEIPQDINLTLSSGTLTMKKGSKIHHPSGTTYTNSSDESTTAGTASDGKYFVITGTGSFLNIVRVDKSCSGATDSLAGTPYHLWYDTSNNTIKEYFSNGTSFGTRAFPLAIITISSGAISSIDQVFNGFGYIGSTIFALPGVKGLIPNGRNADGTLKNTSLTTSGVITRTFATTENQASAACGIDGSSFSRLGTGEYSYNEQENRNYNGSATWGHVFLGYFTLTAGVVSNFETKTAFHAVDYNDASVDFVVASQFPTSANNYTWYRKYKSGWVEQGRFINGGTWSSYVLTDTLPVPMQDDGYTAIATPLGTNADTYITNINSRTTTTISIRRRGGGDGCYWVVYGMAA